MWTAKPKSLGTTCATVTGACIGECPQDALRIIEREAEEFDEIAVEAHLNDGERKAAQPEPEPMACGCPSAQFRTFSPCAQANRPVRQGAAPTSALTHWPVQIRLIPPDAPFLKGAELLVIADCVPVAFPSLHRDFMQGRVVMLGCPKFDDAQAYVDRFTAIFEKAGIKSVTVVVMEVPCCAGLPRIVQKAKEASGANFPFTQVVVSTQGTIIEERKVA